jgi:xanthine dehydrogenase YagT iron-sulfur-binding subunit
MQDDSGPVQAFPNEHEEAPRESMELRQEPSEWPMSRRDFVLGASALIGVSTLASPAAHAAPSSPAAEVKKLPVNLTINGENKQLTVDPRTSLLDLLREDLKLTGTKKGCDHGQCGACTVLCNGRRINSCLALAVSHDGDKISTIEGLAQGEALDPVQQAFLEHDGYQCGYCTPGQIMSAVALLDEARKGSPSFVTADLRRTGPVELTDDEIRERMSGNICRCGAYPGIVAAVRQAYGVGGGQTAGETAEEGDSRAAI